MDPEYMDSLQPKLIEVGCNACAVTLPVTKITYSEADFEGFGFNRTETEPAPIDHMIRSLFIYRENEKPVVMVNYACHPVVNGIDTSVSADYPGQVTAALEALGYQSIFITGFSGDIDPVQPRTYGAMENSAEPLNGDEIRFKTRPISIPFDIPSRAEVVAELLAAKNIMEENPKNMSALQIVSWTADALAEFEKPDFPKSRETYLQAVCVGNLAFIAVPGEMFAAYGLRLRKEFPGIRMFTVNTANGVVGYIPTPDEFDRKGTASHEAARVYGIFTFRRDVGEQMCCEAAELLRNLTSAR
jgi:hypothetical protein